ncbi:ESX secretion-associated protein EspG [Rhodococcus sp. NPDC003318]|uniref:ESX secretion-associated protein EspG n=1 Tax=Rhodococcus sp. NPDC003318 TaxID=3364503 RepID=UPI0036CC8F36
MEFDVLWRLLGRDRLPYPLVYRGDAATEDEHRAARRTAARRIATRLDDALHGALSALFVPAVRVEVFGLHDAGVIAPIRLHAGIRAGVGVAARQLPGADPDRGGDVRITAGPASGLAATIVAALPVVARGAGRGVVVPRPGAGPGSLMRRAGRLDPDEASRVFFGRPRTAVGEIGVLPGPAADWRPSEGGEVVHWMDFADGRYLVRGGDRVVAQPVSGEEFAAELRTLIAAVGAARQANTTIHTAT